MNINLGPCIIGFLIGVALYFLVNRVFILEGIKKTHGHGHGGKSPSKSPVPSQTPPSESLTDDELKLKKIIEGGKTEITTDEMLDEIYVKLDDSPSYLLFYTVTMKIIRDVLSGLGFSDFSVISIDLVFEDKKSTDEFRDLLSKNTKSLIDSDKKLIIFFRRFGPPSDIVGDDYFTTSEAISIANCFKEDVIGISGSLQGDIANLSGLTGLQYLALYQGNVNGNIKNLSGLTGLQYLDLVNTDVNGDIKNLSGLTGLKYLDLAHTDVNGDIKNLSGLKELKYFQISGEGVEGDIKNLSGLKELKYLIIHVDGDNVEGDIMHLSGLKELKYLGISGNIEGDIMHLSGLTELQSLHLANTNVNGKLENLSGLSHLEELYLCPSNMVGDIFSTDNDNIKNLYMRDQSIQSNNDLDKCNGITGFLEVDCSSDMYNCICGDSSVTCDN